MSAVIGTQKFKRSFPDAREFLLSEIVGPNYPVKHLIEQARNKGHITRGKAGRGGGAVNSRDMAMLLTGALAGDTPQIATDAMSQLAVLMPNPDPIGVEELIVHNLEESWWNHSFADVITNLIDAWRQNALLRFEEMSFSVVRSPILFGSIAAISFIPGLKISCTRSI